MGVRGKGRQSLALPQSEEIRSAISDPASAGTFPTYHQRADIFRGASFSCG